MHVPAAVFRALAGAFLLASAVPATAQQGAAVLPLERIFLKPYIAGSRPNGPRISPDGKTILFRWDSSATGKYRMWATDYAGSGAHQLPDTLLGEIAWSPDGSHIACTRGGDLYFSDLAFGVFDRVTKTESYEGGLRWSPDGSRLAFSSGDRVLTVRPGAAGYSELLRPSDKDWSVNLLEFFRDGKRVLFMESNREGLPEFITPRFTGKNVTTSSFRGGIAKQRFGIAPVDTGATLWITIPGAERFYTGDVAVSPTGKQVLLERFSANRKERELFVADTDSGKAKKIYAETDKAWIEAGLLTTRWTPDGNAILTTSEKDGWSHLYTMSPAGRNLRQLTDGEWEIRWFDVVPSGDAVLFLANKEERAQWQLYSLDLKTRKITRLSRKEGTYEDPVMAKDGSYVVATYSAFGRPGELVRVSTAGPAGPVDGTTNGIFTMMDRERQLTNSIPAEFSAIDWVKPEIVRFQARDKKWVPAMIYKPAGFDSTKKYPVVVFVHGAGYLQNVYRGWSYYSREYMFHHRLTQRGYVVFEVEYRGSAGLGRNFRTDVAMHLGGKDLDDELDGLEYLKHLGYIDAGRVGIYGGSYGGFLALMGLFRSDAYACGAALRAVTSWENYYRHNAWYTEARLGTPEDHPEAYRISSPITYADSLKRPLLILHGMVDDNVFFQDAAQLIAKLQKSGKEFELMVYPEEGHSFTEGESWRDEYARIERFFDEHLKKDTR
jgi:dipeptidyl aminopeptidase/acylaminoacyl peptidase